MVTGSASEIVSIISAAFGPLEIYPQTHQRLAAETEGGYFEVSRSATVLKRLAEDLIAALQADLAADED
jgi:hypothetical protein